MARIINAKEIFRDVPASTIDPLLLVDSLGREFSGFIVMSREDEAGEYFILFLEGKDILETGRMSHDHRTGVSLETVKLTFAEWKERFQVSLFEAAREDLERFRMTFHHETEGSGRQGAGVDLAAMVKQILDAPNSATNTTS